MAQYNSSKIITDGLVFYYDMSNSQKSFNGAPTTNSSTGVGIGTYLNTPSDVTSSLTVTTEIYKGQPVYKQVLTPITATGVGYLTNANNPGIGVVTGGGGGAAARFTGHSIFFKPLGGRAALNSSTPIYTHYSNISGWQSTGNFNDMNDGWYRAHVIYYNASGGSDGKYWAINPAGAVINNPITIYWAAPFKEDRNDSTFVSPYTNDTRSTTQALSDIANNNTITATSLTYASDNTFTFNGSSNYVTAPMTLNLATGVSMEMIFKSADIQSRAQGFMQFNAGTSYINFYSSGASSLRWETWVNNASSLGGAFYSPATLTNNTWYHAVGTYDSNGAAVLYINGVAVASAAYSPGSYSAAFNSSLIVGQYAGYASGSIPIAKMYNRALSATEVAQNFKSIKGRYGL